jgi:Mn-containing catalase
MFYTDKKLQYPVRVEKPNPIFARALQQAIGASKGRAAPACNIFSRRGGVVVRSSIVTC